MNKLSLNIEKAHHMICCHDVKLLIDGQAVNEVQKTTFLGIIIDNQLSWRWHIKLTVLLYCKAIIKQSWLNVTILFFVYPYRTYCNHIWGVTYKTRLKRLVILQKKAIRVLAQAGNRTSFNPLYKKLNIVKLENINTYLIGRFMFCVSIDKVPQSFGSLLKKTMNNITRILDLHIIYIYPL